MATAKVKESKNPDIVLEMSFDEAQTLRDLIGHKVAGVYSGRRKHLTAIYSALADQAGIKTNGKDGMLAKWNSATNLKEKS